MTAWTLAKRKVLEVFQPWAGAGLRWRWRMDAGPLGTLRGQSGGAFYTDQPDEKIHGATIEDVAAHAMRCVRQVLRITSAPEAA